MEMYCRQCEQTAKGGKCAAQGVCGKDPKVAALQDLTIHALTGLAVYGKRARELGVIDKNADRLMMEGLFSTVTNVNFDEERLSTLIHSITEARNVLKAKFLEAHKQKTGKLFMEMLPASTDWEPETTLDSLIDQGEEVSLATAGDKNADLQSLREIILYGLKGMAAYADHARVLGKTDETVTSFFYKSLDKLSNPGLTADDLLPLAMELGQVNLKCMEILDSAHTTLLGNPAPAKVSTGVKKGPAVIISGHDLLDLKQLLEQTKGTGVSVYTHGEMLPAHGYPELNKYPHLAGHFGTAWQNQQKEFDNVPAAILFSTNCIQRPLHSYKDRVFTTGLVAWPDVSHVGSTNGKKDFSAVIEKAKALGGFTQDKPGKELMTGFGHGVVLSLAGKIIEAVETKKIRHFFLIGGCDGARPGRNYYSDFAAQVPKDCMILTLACGKFRFNDMELGNIGDFPRLLDMGQCNDAYSAIKVAGALAEAFKCGVNDLPLSMILSWYEQKAVVILLTLLSLGIKNIRLGPTLPAFITPNVLNILVEKFGIKPITTPEKDLKDILG